ncbi:MAG: dolichol kinase [Halobacteriaceae archaeon]
MPTDAGELRRRLVHLAGTAFPLGFLLARQAGHGEVGWQALQALLAVGSAVALLLEALRLGGLLHLSIYDDLIRDYEEDYLAGYAIYLIGMTAAAVVFEAQIAVPAMLMLTVGDPISGMLSAGGLSKQLSVLAVMFGVCLALALPFLPPLAAVAGAAVAAVADGVKPVLWTYVIDDNLTIPIGAATAMWAVLVFGP